MLWITIYYYQNGEKEVDINIKPENTSDHNPILWSTSKPTILSGRSNGELVKVKITIKGNTPIRSDDIEIITENKTISILSKTKSGIIKIVNNHLDKAN